MRYNYVFRIFLSFILIVPQLSLAKLPMRIAETDPSFDNGLVGYDIIDEVIKERPQQEGFFDIIPDGANLTTVDPNCEPQRLEDKVLKGNYTNTQLYEIYNNYFKECGEKLSQNTKKGIFTLINFSRAQYDIYSNPNIKHILIYHPDGSKTPGILALKADKKKRPMVVVKCGVFCSAAPSASVRNYFMTLFDESPFNVLFLANRTAYDFIQKNRILTIGGNLEGKDMVEIGRWLKDTSPYKDVVSSVHLVGLSLGGNAAVFGAQYNEQDRVYNSVTAICPVIDLEASLNSLYNSSVVGRAFYKMTKDQFLSAKPYLTDVPDLIGEKYIPEDRKDVPEYIGKLATTSLVRRGQPVRSDKYEDFWYSNNFLQRGKKVSTPLLVWASEDDVVVSNRLNAGRLQNSSILANNPEMGVVNVKWGSHCAFSSAYGNKAISAVMRSFILSNSPELKENYQLNSMKVNFPKLGLSDDEVHVQQKWKFSKKSEYANVKFYVFSPRKDRIQCRRSDPFSGNSKCLRTIDYSIKISDIKEAGAYIPSNDSEAQSLTRNFNSKFEFWGRTGPLTGTPSRVMEFAWWDI